MRYRKLELLLLSVGLVGVLVSIITALLGGAGIRELIGQALFVPVLFSALHYGRRYGYVAAIIAALVLLMVRTQAFGSLSFSSAEGRQALLQAAGFGVVGIIGGELATRIKYVVAHIADEGFIDSGTGLFSQDYVERMINRLWAGYSRSNNAFSLLFINLSWADAVDDIGQRKQRGRIADILRANVRLVDEVGSLKDGRFCLILPDTTAEGAKTVQGRLAKAYSKSRQHSRLTADWRDELLSLPQDEERIKELVPDGTEFHLESDITA